MPADQGWGEGSRAGLSPHRESAPAAGRCGTMRSMGSSRELAADLLARLLEGERSVPRVEPDGPEGSAERDARFAAELAHGVARTLSRLDRAIERASGKPVGRIAAPVLPIVRLGAYQLLFMPSVPRYAAVSESVDLARRRAPRAAGFVNWVLRRMGPELALAPSRDEYPDDASWLAAVHSFPPWLVKRWVHRLGAAEAGELMAALNAHPPLHLRVNRLRAGPAAVAQDLAGEGIAVEAGRHAPCSLRLAGPGRVTAAAPFAAGLVYVQDESSQLAAEVLAPAPGERVLDACAGLGGKSTQLAEIAGGRATVIALDSDASRLRKLEENVRRLDDPGIEVRRGDLLDAATLAGERFDAILLDAPCTGLGTLGRHPALRWTKRPGDPARLAAVQGRMLARVASLLAPGGRVSYSTCSTEPEEGEEVLAAFLAVHPDFAVDQPPPGALLRPDELATPGGFVRSWPHRHGMGGAFVALLRRA